MTTPESPFSAIKERLERATPGPWKSTTPPWNEGWVYVVAPDQDEHDVISKIEFDGDEAECRADAEFIAAAPSDIRTLLEAVEEKDAEIARLRAMTGHWMRCGEFNCTDCIAAEEWALKGSDSSEGGRG